MLPDIISKEPLSPFVRQGDSQWFDVVRWVHFALVIAEEQGLTKANVEERARTTESPELKRILGRDGNFGEQLGLPNDWVSIVKQWAIRRGVRSQPRPGVADEDRARAERAVDQRRPAIRRRRSDDRDEAAEPGHWSAPAYGAIPEPVILMVAGTEKFVPATVRAAE